MPISSSKAISSLVQEKKLFKDFYCLLLACDLQHLNNVCSLSLIVVLNKIGYNWPVVFEDMYEIVIL